MTVFFGVVLVLLAWLLVSGIEGKREMGALNPPASTPGTGAVLVIGGTRATGLEVVRLLRARGDEVVVLVRPASDGSAAEQLGARVVRGDAMNQPDIAAALAPALHSSTVDLYAGIGGAHCHRPRQGRETGARAVKGARPDFEGNRNAMDAARSAGVTRFVLVTVIGAGDSHEASPWIARRFLDAVMKEKTKAEDYLKTSGLKYTIIRPGGLLDKEAQGRAYLTEDTRSMSWIRRADLARLVVQALDDPQAIGKTYHAFDPDRTRFWSIPAN